MRLFYFSGKIQSLPMKWVLVKLYRVLLFSTKLLTMVSEVLSWLLSLCRHWVIGNGSLKPGQILMLLFIMEGEYISKMYKSRHHSVYFLNFYCFYLGSHVDKEFIKMDCPIKNSAKLIVYKEFIRIDCQ